MTIDEAERAAGKITYKPGWRFGISSDEAYVAKLSVSASAICVNSGKEIDVVSSTTMWIGDWMEEDLIRGFVEIILRVERHEVAEHLRFGGLRVAKPHPEAGEERTAFSVSLL